MTIWRKCIVCLVPKATNIYSKYVINIAFPPQKVLYDSASSLRYTYCLSYSNLYSEFDLKLNVCAVAYGHSPIKPYHV